MFHVPGLELFKLLRRIIQSTERRSPTKENAFAFGTEMVTLLITAFAVFLLFAVGVYFWQKPSTDYSANILPPPPNPRGLFGEEPSTAAETERLALLSQRREEIFTEAANGDRAALAAAHQLGNSDFCNRVLDELVRVSDSDPKLLSLLSYLSQNELPVNRSVAEAVLSSWKRSPDRNGTARALHFAALSDDADLYRSAVENALQMWREAKLGGVSAVELRSLFDGEFWVLSSRSRSSGAGFVLKRTLDGARRELEAAGATRNDQNSSSPKTSSKEVEVIHEGH